MKESKMKKIICVSVPFLGHNNIMEKMIMKIKDKYEVKLVICGWNNVPIPKINQDIKVDIIKCEDIEDTSPIDFTFKRCKQTTDILIEYLKDKVIDCIVYDFFALEAYIAGKILGIQTVCSIPAIIGEKIDHSFLQESLIKKQHEINDIQLKYNIQLELETVSDSFLQRGDMNLIWLSKKFYEQSILDNSHFLSSTNNYFISLDDTVNTNKSEIIYVNFGTVVTGNLWNQKIELRNYLIELYQKLIQSFSYISSINTYKNFKMIISIPYQSHYIKNLISLPPNVQIVDYINQEQILQQTKIFITHGGGNSLREAIFTHTPMIVIPFFGDQIDSCRKVIKLNLGDGFDIKNRSTQKTNFRHYEIDNISSMILNLLHNYSWFQSNFTSLSSDPNTISISDLVFPDSLNFKEGDLLFGTNKDRLFLSNLINKKYYFNVLDLQPFSLFSNPSLGHLPRLIDQYNDVIRDPLIFQREISFNTNTNYSSWLLDFHNFLLLNKHQYLSPSFAIPSPHSIPSFPIIDNNIVTLWNMCLGGLHYFLYHKKISVHFVVDDFDWTLNYATLLELQWLYTHWSDIGSQVHFYKTKPYLAKVDPFQYNWFLDTSRFQSDFNTLFSHINNLKFDFHSDFSYRLKTPSSLVRKLFSLDLISFFSSLSSSSLSSSSLSTLMVKSLLLSHSQSPIKDIIGFRFVHPWSDNLKILSSLLESNNILHVVDKKFKENNKIIYLYGITDHHIYYEIQLWPSILYHCFQYEYPIIYKSLLPISDIVQTKSQKLRSQQSQLQNTIDQNCLVPY